MHHHNYPLEEIDGFEIENPAVDTGENFEAITEDTVFNETDEMELAEQLLEIADKRELDRLLGTLIARAMGEAPRLAPLRPLRGILRNAAMCALPAICGPGKNIPMASRNGSDAGRVADMAGSLLGLEFEGGGGENREFEVARHFVRFAGTSARNVPHFHAAAPPEIAARRAVDAAVLQELYESPRRTGEGLLNFEYPLLFAEDEELDYFLGKMFRGVTRAVGNFAKAIVKNPIKAFRDAATSVASGIADLSSSVADTLGKIPIIGAGLKGLYGFTYDALIQSASNVVGRLEECIHACVTLESRGHGPRGIGHRVPRKNIRGAGFEKPPDCALHERLARGGHGERPIEAMLAVPVEHFAKLGIHLIEEHDARAGGAGILHRRQFDSAAIYRLDYALACRASGSVAAKPSVSAHNVGSSAPCPHTSGKRRSLSPEAARQCKILKGDLAIQPKADSG